MWRFDAILGMGFTLFVAYGLDRWVQSTRRTRLCFFEPCRLFYKQHNRRLTIGSAQSNPGLDRPVPGSKKLSGSRNVPGHRCCDHNIPVLSGLYPWGVSFLARPRISGLTNHLALLLAKYTFTHHQHLNKRHWSDWIISNSNGTLSKIFPLIPGPNFGNLGNQSQNVRRGPLHQSK